MKASPFVSFVSKFGNWLFICAAIPAVVFSRLVLTEFNAPYVFAFKFLALPICVACMAFGFRYREEFQLRTKRRNAFWIYFVVVPLLLVLFSGGWVAGLNAFLPPQTDFVLVGKVTEKFMTHGRYSTSWIVGVDGELGPMRIEVSREEYQNTYVGAEFNQPRKMGPFGFSYVWR